MLSVTPGLGLAGFRATSRRATGRLASEWIWCGLTRDGWCSDSQ
jgi:hypothetical protein